MLLPTPISWLYLVSRLLQTKVESSNFWNLHLVFTQMGSSLIDCNFACTISSVTQFVLFLRYFLANSFTFHWTLVLWSCFAKFLLMISDLHKHVQCTSYVLEVSLSKLKIEFKSWSRINYWEWDSKGASKFSDFHIDSTNQKLCVLAWKRRNHNYGVALY